MDKVTQVYSIVYRAATQAVGIKAFRSADLPAWCRIEVHNYLLLITGKEWLQLPDPHWARAARSRGLSALGSKAAMLFSHRTKMNFGKCIFGYKVYRYCKRWILTGLVHSETRTLTTARNDKSGLAAREAISNVHSNTMLG